MVTIIDTEDRENLGYALEPAADCARSGRLAADLRQIGLVFALIAASLIWFLWVNDFRTSLSLLHSAGNCWPKTMGWSLHSFKACA